MNNIEYSQLMKSVKNVSIKFAIETGLLFKEDQMDFPHYTKTPEYILKSVFGYDSFRSMQKSVIQNVLSGRDTLAVMPTGGGKSLCYEIPALIMNGLTIVVSPLIALMQDQVQQLESYNIPAIYINSSLDWETCKKHYEKIKRGEIKLLYVSPEGLKTDRIRNLLHSPNVIVDCITIDEAHCISQWGHDFRPDYMEISKFRKEFPRAICLALTATATKQVQHDIVSNLNMDTPDILVASFNRPNIFLNVQLKSNPINQVLEFINNHIGQSGIIYCFSRKQVDEVTNKLQLNGLKVLNYHAGLSDNIRAKNQIAFIQDKVDIIVATVAFGMGINKPDVRYVIHYDMPKSIEQYYQEIGRAGRDGLESEALLLYSVADIRKIRFLLNESYDCSKSEKLLQGMINYAETKICRRKTLLAYFGENYNFNAENIKNSYCCDICYSCAENKKPKTILIKNADKQKEQNSTFKSFPKPIRANKKTSTSKIANRFNLEIQNDSVATIIMEQLKTWRKKASEELRVPPYVIFGDKSIIDIAAKKPRTQHELLNCHGIGEIKAEKFGYYILCIVKENLD